MENTIQLTVTAEGQTRKVSFKTRKKDGKVYVGFYLEEECVGDMELTLDNYNKFCLDLFSQHKKITSENQSRKCEYCGMTDGIHKSDCSFMAKIG